MRASISVAAFLAFAAPAGAVTITELAEPLGNQRVGPTLNFEPDGRHGETWHGRPIGWLDSGSQFSRFSFAEGEVPGRILFSDLNDVLATESVTVSTNLWSEAIPKSPNGTVFSFLLGAGIDWLEVRVVGPKVDGYAVQIAQIGRASCRERV